MSSLKHPTDFKAKVTIRKVLEVSYSGDKGVKLAAALKKGPVTFKLDNKGNISSSAKLGRYSIRGFNSVKALGVEIKFIKITARLKDNGDVAYSAGISYGAFFFDVSGAFDIEKIVDRGFLKSAYDPIKNRAQKLEDTLEKSGVR